MWDRASNLETKSLFSVNYKFESVFDFVHQQIDFSSCLRKLQIRVGCHIFYSFSKVVWLCVVSLLDMMSKSFCFYNPLYYQTDILLKMGVYCLLLSRLWLAASVWAWLQFLTFSSSPAENHIKMLLCLCLFFYFFFCFPWSVSFLPTLQSRVRRPGTAFSVRLRSWWRRSSRRLAYGRARSTAGGSSSATKTQAVEHVEATVLWSRPHKHALIRTHVQPYAHEYHMQSPI